MSRGASSSTVIPIPILELGGGVYTLDNMAKVESGFGRKCCETRFTCPEAMERTPVSIERDDPASEFSSSKSLVVMACLNFCWHPQRLLEGECLLLHSKASSHHNIVSVTLIAERMRMKRN